MKLNQLSDNPGATKKRKRIGRGPGSGTGKMGGRGIKGQKSRSGVAINGYEGGQMPLYQRLPKRGFNNINAKTYAVVNLGLLQKFIDEKKIDIKKPITQESLVESGLVRRVKDGVRILNKGAITSKIDLTVSGASKAAIAAVEAAGGKLTVTTAPKLDAEA
jgi:large subunit ribosomal protein L15